MELIFKGKHEYCSNTYSTTLCIYNRHQDATVDKTHDSGTRRGADELFSTVSTGPLWAYKDVWKTGRRCNGAQLSLGAKEASLKVVDQLGSEDGIKVGYWGLKCGLWSCCPILPRESLETEAADPLSLQEIPSALCGCSQGHRYRCSLRTVCNLRTRAEDQSSRLPSTP